MKSNKLFHFIKALHSTGEAIIDQKLPNFKKDKAQTHYVFYELDNNYQFLVVQNTYRYNLISHHISFYENQDDKNAHLSQYHYTAYFRDESNEEHRLHVYFDEHDQVLSVQFAKIAENQSVKRKLDPFELINLSQLATTESLIFIQELRKLYDNNLKKIENNYQQLCGELETLSNDLEKNFTLYKEKTDEIITVLKQLSFYYPDNYYYQLLHLFRSIRKSEFTAEENRQLTTEKSQITTKEFYRQKKSASTTTSRRLPTRRSINLSIKPLFLEAKEAQEKYMASKNSSDEQRLPTLLLYITAAQNLIMASIDKNYTVNEKEACDIQSLIKHNLQETESILTRLLITNSFTLADALKSFLKPLSSKLIILALKTGNAQLLNYILENDAIPINTFIVTDNLTPVLFCLMRHTEAKPLVECMSVLVKHKANLFIKSPDGLPVAHHIALSVQHPLRKALLDNVALTLGNSAFYKQLIVELQKSNSGDLSSAIEVYQQALLFLNKKGTANTGKQVIDADFNLKEIEDHFSSFNLDALRNDPDFVIIKNQYMLAYNSFVSKLSKKEANRLVKLSNDILSNVNTLIKNVDISSQNIKESSISYLKEMTEMFYLRSELYDVQNALRKPIFNPKDKKRKKLLNRERELLNLIKPLESKYEILMDQEKTEQAVDAIQIQNKYKALEGAEKNLQSIQKILEKILKHEADSITAEQLSTEFENLANNPVIADMMNNKEFADLMQSLGIFSPKTKRLAEPKVDEENDEGETSNTMTKISPSSEGD